MKKRTFYHKYRGICQELQSQLKYQSLVAHLIVVIKSCTRASLSPLVHTCVIQEHWFSTICLSQYHGCCQYHESKSISWNLVNPMTSCIYLTTSPLIIRYSLLCKITSSSYGGLWLSAKAFWPSANPFLAFSQDLEVWLVNPSTVQP